MGLKNIREHILIHTTYVLLLCDPKNVLLFYFYFSFFLFCDAIASQNSIGYILKDL